MATKGMKVVRALRITKIAGHYRRLFPGDLAEVDAGKAKELAATKPPKVQILSADEEAAAREAGTAIYTSAATDAQKAADEAMAATTNAPAVTGTPTSAAELAASSPSTSGKSGSK
ncbi:MAG TPA: hypothetical protein VD838_21115 [Anaeromyxobacteraceae bacterium]|nr:hypothetical protein [Anaeromyxobacteraceae bacterium]